MVAPITRFSLLPPVSDEPGQKGHVSVEPAKKPVSSAPLVVAGAVIGLTLFAVTAVVTSGKRPLERQLIKLVNHLFPVGPKREWLLTGFPRYAYLPHLPNLTPDLAPPVQLRQSSIPKRN